MAESRLRPDVIGAALLALIFIVIAAELDDAILGGSSG